MIGPEQFQDMVRQLPAARPPDYIHRRDMHYDRYYGRRYRDFEYHFAARSMFAPEPPRSPFHDPDVHVTKLTFLYGEDYLQGVPVGFWKYGELMVKVFPL